MIEETLVAGRAGLRPLRQIVQKAQPLARALGCEIAEEDAALDNGRDRRERHAHRGNAGRRGGIGLVADEAVVRVGFVQVVENGRELKMAEVPFGERRIQPVHHPRLELRNGALVDHRRRQSRSGPFQIRTAGDSR